MERSVSGTDECSKTSLSIENNRDGMSDQSEENESESKARNGGSSSNSTVEENDKKQAVRPYVRSKMPRLRWTPDLHLRFVHAVERLGGQDRATPKLVLEHMNIKGLSIAHVKSHLQMYRSKKIDDPGQAIADHRHLVESGDRNIYNLSQLPMLRGYSQGNSSNYRYDALWSSRTCNEYLTRIPNASRSRTDDPRPAAAGLVHGSATDRRFGSNTSNWSTDYYNFQKKGNSSNFGWKVVHEPKKEFQDPFPNLDHQPRSGAPIERLATNLQEISCMGMKRKATESECEIDLDLSLRLTGREGDHDDVGNELSLSLCSATPSSTKLISSRLKGEGLDNNSTRASTLDLTI